MHNPFMRDERTLCSGENPRNQATIRNKERREPMSVRKTPETRPPFKPSEREERTLKLGHHSSPVRGRREPRN
jgi:hypothetical protein